MGTLLTTLLPIVLGFLATVVKSWLDSRANTASAKASGQDELILAASNASADMERKYAGILAQSRSRELTIGRLRNHTF